MTKGQHGDTLTATMKAGSSTNASSGHSKQMSMAVTALQELNQLVDDQGGSLVHSERCRVWEHLLHQPVRHLSTHEVTHGSEVPHDFEVPHYLQVTHDTQVTNDSEVAHGSHPRMRNPIEKQNLADISSRTRGDTASAVRIKSHVSRTGLFQGESRNAHEKMLELILLTYDQLDPQNSNQYCHGMHLIAGLLVKVLTRTQSPKDEEIVDGESATNCTRVQTTANEQAHQAHSAKQTQSAKHAQFTARHNGNTDNSGNGTIVSTNSEEIDDMMLWSFVYVQRNAFKNYHDANLSGIQASVSVLESLLWARERGLMEHLKQLGVCDLKIACGSWFLSGFVSVLPESLVVGVWDTLMITMASRAQNGSKQEEGNANDTDTNISSAALDVWMATSLVLFEIAKPRLLSCQTCDAVFENLRLVTKNPLNIAAISSLTFTELSNRNINISTSKRSDFLSAVRTRWRELQEQNVVSESEEMCDGAVLVYNLCEREQQQQDQTLRRYETWSERVSEIKLGDNNNNNSSSCTSNSNNNVKNNINENNNKTIGNSDNNNSSSSDDDINNISNDNSNNKNDGNNNSNSGSNNNSYNNIEMNSRRPWRSCELSFPFHTELGLFLNTSHKRPSSFDTIAGGTSACVPLSNTATRPFNMFNTDNKIVVIMQFKRFSNGHLMAVEATGRVHVGDQLRSVNDVLVFTLSDITRELQNIRKKRQRIRLVFVPACNKFDLSELLRDDSLFTGEAATCGGSQDVIKVHMDSSSDLQDVIKTHTDAVGSATKHQHHHNRKRQGNILRSKPKPHRPSRQRTRVLSELHGLSAWVNQYCPKSTSPQSIKTNTRSDSDTANLNRWWDPQVHVSMGIDHILTHGESIYSTMDCAALLFPAFPDPRECALAPLSQTTTPAYSRSPGRLFLTSFQLVFRPLSCICKASLDGHEKHCNVSGRTSANGVPLLVWFKRRMDAKAQRLSYGKLEHEDLFSRKASKVQIGSCEDQKQEPSFFYPNAPDAVRVPLACIAGLDLVGDRVLVVRCKDVRVVRLLFVSAAQRHGFRLILEATAFTLDRATLFAFSQPLEDENDGERSGLKCSVNNNNNNTNDDNNSTKKNHNNNNNEQDIVEPKSKRNPDSSPTRTRTKAQTMMPLNHVLIEDYKRLGLVSPHAEPDIWDGANSMLPVSTRSNASVYPFRVVDQGADYQLCSTYPRFLVLPTTVSDSDVLKSSAFRSRGRVPVVVWKRSTGQFAGGNGSINTSLNNNSYTGGGILARSAQPLPGLRKARCREDERLVFELMSPGTRLWKDPGTVPEEFTERSLLASQPTPLSASNTDTGNTQANHQRLNADNFSSDIKANGSGGGVLSRSSFDSVRGILNDLGASLSSFTSASTPLTSDMSPTVVLNSVPEAASLAHIHENANINSHSDATDSGDGNCGRHHHQQQQQHESTDRLNLTVTHNDIATANDNSAVTEAPPFVIVDARSRIAAMSNRVIGKGTEDPNNYPGASLEFLNIDNIHVVRSCFEKHTQGQGGGGGGLGGNSLGTSSSSSASGGSSIHAIDDAEFLRAQSAAAAWLGQVRSVIRASAFVARQVDQGVSTLVHCSDGWDRASQLTSLAQLLLDPFYRTIRGFGVLVEKEWLGFGHCFLDRCGLFGYPEKDDNISPVFVLWVDCVWQILLQFPYAFEFNEQFLVALLDHVHAGRFQTFFFSAAKERESWWTQQQQQYQQIQQYQHRQQQERRRQHRPQKEEQQHEEQEQQKQQQYHQQHQQPQQQQQQHYKGSTKHTIATEQDEPKQVDHIGKLWHALDVPMLRNKNFIISQNGDGEVDKGCDEVLWPSWHPQVLSDFKIYLGRWDPLVTSPEYSTSTYLTATACPQI